MEYHLIDMSTYPRQAHFACFNAMPDPYVGVTVDVEVGPMLEVCRKENWPFWWTAFISARFTTGSGEN